ncbi:hypothetical protein thsrh120_62560 [Rhizobium sp. No.120]
MVRAWKAPKAGHRFDCEYIRGPGRKNGALVIFGDMLRRQNIARMGKMSGRIQQMRRGDRCGGWVAYCDTVGFLSHIWLHRCLIAKFRPR